MRDGTLNRRIYVVVGKKGKIRKIISYWLLEQQIISEELRAANLVALSLYYNYIRRFKTYVCIKLCDKEHNKEFI